MNDICVIGMGLSEQDLTTAHLDIIHSADLLVGGRRHLEPFRALGMDKHTTTGDIEKTIEVIKARTPDQRIVVLASGDPLFYGIGARLVEAFGLDRVTVMPNISSVAAAFARINTPWSEALVVSLHGRDQRYRLFEALKSDKPVAVLTDREQTPNWLAGWLSEQGITHVEMVVLEKMGTPEENIGRYDLQQAAVTNFAQPNVIILLRHENEPVPDQLHIGMNDENYEHERGLITKSEVRAVTLSKLCLKPGLTLWDLGAGSGSVGIEASVLLGPGRIIAVEQAPDRVALIQRNAKRFGVYNHQTVQVKLPDGLETLPRPDRIFIGGGGRDLKTIIQRSIQKLTPDGVVVVNSVLLDNMTAAVIVLEASGFNTEVIQLQVHRSKAMPWSQRLEAQNPVWIISGKRKI